MTLACPPGQPESMCNLDTVRFECTKVINELAGEVESQEIVEILKSQDMVGLGVECNFEQPGIHAVSVATPQRGVFVYILAGRRLPKGLRKLLENSACRKFFRTGRYRDDHLALLERLAKDFKLVNLSESLWYVDELTVESVTKEYDIREFIPGYSFSHSFSDYFNERRLGPGPLGYMALKALMPVLVAARLPIVGVDLSDFPTMKSYLKKYDVNEGSRAAVLEAQRLREGIL
ncbi:hypothetical protein FOZ62_030637 [Perkinsus olseni]|nr:hypothetical protein FOZ62_030637 [Perkinsus olseni]